MTLLIMAICTVLFEKLYRILRQKEPRRQEITNFSFFEIFEMFINMFKLKFDTKTNSNLQNSMMVFILCFKLKIATLFGTFVPKNCNCQFIFLCFRLEVYYFRKFVPKIKIFC